MSQFRRLLKAIHISAPQLSEAMGMPIRTLTHNYNSGRIPYALVYKIHKITGIPMEEVVPKALAESWLYLFDEQIKSNLPRGVKAQLQSKAREKRVEDWAQPVKELAPKKKRVPRGTVVHTTVVPTSVTPDIPKSVTPNIPNSISPPKQAKKSIADIMKAAPPTPEEDAPDIGKIDDSLFNTSADQVAGKH